MLKNFFLLLILFLTGSITIAQTVSNPGLGDPLYPVTNFTNDYVYSNQLNRDPSAAFGFIKKSGKYFLAGDYTAMADNSGSALLLDTVSKTILNNRKWRINGTVKTAIPDGQGGFYIGGSFTMIGDSSRNYIAQIGSNGKPTAWKPAADGFVNVIFKRNDTLFIGGAFRTFAGSNRKCFAMYKTSTNSLVSNGGNDVFSGMSSINCFVLQKDTLIYGGVSNSPSQQPTRNIKKFNIKNNTIQSWEIGYTEFGIVNHIQLSPDESLIIYAAYYNGEYIKAAHNRFGYEVYNIGVSMYWPNGSNSGAVWGLKVLGNKVYAVGNFEHVMTPGVNFRKGFFSFSPLTGAVLPDDLGLNGYAYFLDTSKGKLFLSGKFTSVKNINRNQFAVLDTGNLVVDSFKVDPSDPITSIAFAGIIAFIGGQFKGIYSANRNGLAAIDSTSRNLEAWTPAGLNIKRIKRMAVKGDSLFVLGYTSTYYLCAAQAETVFKIYSISTGAEYSIGGAPLLYMDDFVIDGNYVYITNDRRLRRYILPTMAWDIGWGTDWSQTNYQHSMNYLIVDGNKIYAVGDTKYYSCASTLYPKRGMFDVYNKSNGQIINTYYYEGASNLYDNIGFNNAILCNDRLYLQGSFSQLNGNPRRNFFCLNINTGAITGWQAGFPNLDLTQSYFDQTSELKLFNGKIWFGSYTQALSDGSTFKGFGAMDTLTGNLVSQPLNLRLRYLNGNANFGFINDFILTDTELSIAGVFDSVNNQPFHNFAVFHLTGTNSSSICPSGSSTITAEITGTSYQWQMDSGSGFVNINDNANFSGTQGITLSLANIPSNWYGYKFRCLVSGNTSEVYQLKFTNSWTGAVSNAWENSGNWSCGAMPDIFTDVMINSGTIIINANTGIRSMTLSPGVNLIVNPGITLTVIH